MKMTKKMARLISIIVLTTLVFDAVLLNAKEKGFYFKGSSIQERIDEVQNEIKKTSSYLISYYKSEGMQTTDIKELILLQQSGVDCSELVNQYINKIAPKTPYEYAGAIFALTLAGYDVTNYNGINLIQEFESQLSATTNEEMSNFSVVNPYYLPIISYVIASYKAQFKNPIKLMTLIKEATISYYTDDGAGTTGFDYYGISADNNGSILPALLPVYTYDDTIQPIIFNTVTWTKNQVEADGTIQSWGVPSASSTGLALALFSEVGSEEFALKTYEGLLRFKSSHEGAYVYENEDSIFSTKDALRGLMAYLFYLEGKGSYFDLSSAIQQNLAANANEKEERLQNVTNEYNQLINTKILLDKQTKGVYLNKSTKSFYLKPTITGTTKKATFTSLKPNIASVDETSGKVTVKAIGSTIVCASVNGKSAVCLVTVKKPVVSLNKSNITLKKKESFKIRVTTKPKAKATYTVKNKAIVKVTATGKIIAKKKGKTMVTVKANHLRKKISVKVR